MSRKKTGTEILAGLKRDLERLYNFRFIDQRRGNNGPLMALEKSLDDADYVPVPVTSACESAVHELELALDRAERTLKRMRANKRHDLPRPPPAKHHKDRGAARQAPCPT